MSSASRQFTVTVEDALTKEGVAYQDTSLADRLALHVNYARYSPSWVLVWIDDQMEGYVGWVRGSVERRGIKL
jgi:hypothetical protein